MPFIDISDKNIIGGIFQPSICFTRGALFTEVVVAWCDYKYKLCESWTELFHGRTELVSSWNSNGKWIRVLWDVKLNEAWSVLISLIGDLFKYISKVVCCSRVRRTFVRKSTYLLSVDELKIVNSSKKFIALPLTSSWIAVWKAPKSWPKIKKYQWV